MDAGGVTFSGTCGLMHWVKLLGVLTLLSLKCSGFITSMEGSEGESGLDRPCFAPPPPPLLPWWSRQFVHSWFCPGLYNGGPFHRLRDWVKHYSLADL